MFPYGQNFAAISFRMPKHFTLDTLTERLFEVRRLSDRACFRIGKDIIVDEESTDPTAPNRYTLLEFTEDEETGKDDLGFTAKNHKTGHSLIGQLNDSGILPFKEETNDTNTKGRIG